jgi:ATP-dependent 26S proteasome regulatory subunit
MNNVASPINRSRKLRGGFCLLCACSVLIFAGCRRGKHTSNARLRQIDDMLDSQLHPGVTKGRVIAYLSSQGFPVEQSVDPQSVVAIVRHVDPNTLQPETARITFHFDAHDKLLTYELVPASGPLLQP